METQSISRSVLPFRWGFGAPPQRSGAKVGYPGYPVDIRIGNLSPEKPLILPKVAFTMTYRSFFLKRAAVVFLFIRHKLYVIYDYRRNLVYIHQPVHHKRHLATVQQTADGSLPPRGAWIEIFALITLSMRRSVAPLTGSVD